MECSVSVQDMVSGAVMKCPFLAAVAHRHGEGFARGLVCKSDSSTDQAGCRRPVFEESITDFQSTLNLFHGPSGILPLRRLFAADSGATSGPASKSEPSESLLRTESCRSACSYSPLVTAAPFATISLPFFNFLPGPDNFLQRVRKQRRKNRKPGKDQQSKRNPPPEHPNAAPGSSSGIKTASKGTVKPLSGRRPPPAQPSGRCPLRNWPILGGLIPLSAKGDLACPTAIVAMRAAVARLKVVKDLRPQGLPVKLIAIGAAGLLANIPFGMWRAHLPKFSPGWFVAVHVTVPFIAMLRKAVVMPKWAIILTVAAAVAGQMIGTRLERYRLACIAKEAYGSATKSVEPAGGKVPQTCSHTSLLPAYMPGMPHAFHQEVVSSPWIHVV
eukprot:jgi/Botrbrau1/16887/Bobra.150_2s0101.1